jgi:hypothetical protein
MPKMLFFVARLGQFIAGAPSGYLYTAPTPNGHKVAIALEELSLPYRLHILDLEKRQQKEGWYLKTRPRFRAPGSG